MILYEMWERMVVNMMAAMLKANREREALADKQKREAREKDR